MGRPSKLQLARRSASCRRADVRVRSKAARHSISLTLEILLEDVSQDVAAHRRMVPGVGQADARSPRPVHAAGHAWSVYSIRGLRRLGVPCSRTMRVWGFGTMLPNPLGGGHHRIPD